MEKKKLTLQQKLDKRTYKTPNRFYNWIYHFIMADIKLGKHNPEIIYKDDIRKETGPCFIIWNHLSRLDHSFICKATYPKRFSMVAEYNEFFRSHLAAVFKMMHILPKKNFCVDVKGMRAMLSIINQGGCVTIAPEGLATITGYNERILPGTGNLLKHCKVPVYLFQFRGQSLAAPVFSPYYRYGGKTEVTVSKLFTPERLRELKTDEIEQIIQSALKNDDYECKPNTSSSGIREEKAARACTRSAINAPTAAENLLCAARATTLPAPPADLQFTRTNISSLSPTALPLCICRSTFPTGAFGNESP